MRPGGTGVPFVHSRAVGWKTLKPEFILLCRTSFSGMPIAVAVTGGIGAMERNQISDEGMGVSRSAAQEELLVNRCLEGDSAAWETMVRTYARQIIGMVRRYTHIREEAEDLTQEVFLRVYLNLRTFRSDNGKLSHWLRRVGRNLIIDHLRRRHRLPLGRGGELHEALHPGSERSDAPEARLARNETSSMLHRCLGLLVPELQQVLVLKYLREMSCREISRMLGMPEGTVKSRIYRGRAKLAEHYQHSGFSSHLSA
jgi:RNA polymerase sigma-70 factor (ECF subfamily)